MIDTIKLELPQSLYTIIDHDLFEPSTYDMFACDLWTKGKVLHSKQNASNKDRKEGIYKPRLTVTRRPLKALGYQNTLYVEISLPKLIFGNNLDELKNEDFQSVKSSLTRILRTMGVLVYESKLDQAKVSAIHFGKNFILDDYTTPYTYIKELKNIDIKKTFDVNQTDYRNGGMSYKLHTNLFEFTIYDKLKDLEQSKFSEKRAIDKNDQCQLSLLEHIEKIDRQSNPFQVLRIEMRLNKRTIIKQTLKRFGADEIVTFEYLFNQDLAKKMLLSFYSQIFNQYIPIIESSSSSKIFQELLENNPKMKEGKLLELATVQSIIYQNGVREFRNMIRDKTWCRIKKNLKNLAVPRRTNYLYKIKNQLEIFKCIRLIDYPHLLLNNVN